MFFCFFLNFFSVAFVDLKKTGGISNVCVAGVLLFEPEPQWIVSSVLVALLWVLIGDPLDVIWDLCPPF